jgi:hypothetical protein
MTYISAVSFCQLDYVDKNCTKSDCLHSLYMFLLQMKSYKELQYEQKSNDMKEKNDHTHDPKYIKHTILWIRLSAG